MHAQPPTDLVKLGFNLTDTPTGIGSDTMDVEVAPDAMINAAIASPSSTTIYGYGLQQSVSSVRATTPQLPADTYDLAVWCKNLIDDCFFTTDVSAFY